jgi:translation initiation factor 3 subunit D
MLEQIPFANFTKLSFAVNDQPEDLLVCGAVDSYDLPREHEGPGKFQSSPAAVSSQAA